MRFSFSVQVSGSSEGRGREADVFPGTKTFCSGLGLPLAAPDSQAGANVSHLCLTSDVWSQEPLLGMEGERVDRAGGTSHQHITSTLETLPSETARRAQGGERRLKGQRQLAFLQPDYRSAEPAPVNS